ncbi:hypothetical protein [Streptomyces sp. NPDC014734]|uniref:hypothetical protein n=1 Tax=Streptomyces sp. NPDC014734 TaxID=3364886 RepID=UPI0036F520B2
MAVRGKGSGERGRPADPDGLGEVLVRYRERPTMGKLALTVAPVVAFRLFIDVPEATHGVGHLVFDAVCALLFVWGVFELIRSLASWLVLYEDGIVYRGRSKVRWALRWEDIHDVVLTRHVTHLGSTAIRPVSNRVEARIELAPGPGSHRLSGNYFLTDTGGSFLRTLLRSPGTLTPMFGEIIERVVAARAGKIVRELADGGDVRYDSFEIGATYLYVHGAADEIAWDEVTRLVVDDHQVAITVPHLRRRMEGLRLGADGRRGNYRVGGDNTLYIEAKGMSPCQRAVIWSVMSHIADSLEADKKTDPR